MRKSRIIFLMLLVFLCGCSPPNPEAELHRAAFAGKTEKMKALLDQGEDVNKLVDGETALMRAAKGGKPESVALLLGSGADAGLKNSDGKDVWDLLWLDKKSFVTSREASCLAMLIDHGVEPKVSLLELARDADSALLVTKLVEKGADVAQVDELGWTPLHHAAFEGNEESCLALLQAGSDVNAESTKEYAAYRTGKHGKKTVSFRYEIGSRPLDVVESGRSSRGKSPRQILQEWGGTKNPEVDNRRKH